MPQWTRKDAGEWHQKQPQYIGANFYPSTAINQLEMWQAETFDPETIRRELGFARDLGMNIMRVYLHDLLWLHDPDGFCERIDRYLDMSSELGIRTLFVIFDDCWRQEFSWGAQPEPIPYTHNSGWVESPGLKAAMSPDEWPRLEAYVKGLLDRFKDDERIVAWDLYNEPGNTWVGDGDARRRRGDDALPLLQEVFEWARDVDRLTQPLTACVWTFDGDFTKVNDFVLSNSDIISFHNYGPVRHLASTIQKLEGYDRPMICTEYMARTEGSTFEFCLPLLTRHGIGAINWGLVAGKSNTIYPWGWSADKGDPPVWFHDIFRPDGSMLYPHERELITRVTTPAL